MQFVLEKPRLFAVFISFGRVKAPLSTQDCRDLSHKIP